MHASSEGRSSTTAHHQITWSLEFKDQSLATKYVCFKEASSLSSLAMWLVAAFYSVIFILQWSIIIVRGQVSFGIGAGILTFALVIIPIWGAAIFRNRISVENDLLSGKQRRLLVFAESWSAVSTVIALILVLVSRLIAGSCQHTNDYILSFACVPGEACSLAPGDTCLLLLFTPAVFLLAYASIPWKIIQVSTCLTVSAIIGCCVYLKADNSATVMSVTTLFVLVVLYNVRLQQMQLFIYTTKYYRSLDLRCQEKEESSKRLNLEMKNMIASISHDMKTPLAAFVCGLDGLRELITKFQHQPHHGGSIQCEVVTDVVMSINGSLRGIHGAYQSLVMNINRCTEFTKTAHGISLTPVLERVDLGSATQEVVIGLQSLLDTDHSIVHCVEHDVAALPITTDRQWFQDNLLTLLNNAVQYSTPHHPVDVRVHLVHGENDFNLVDHSEHVVVEVENVITSDDASRAFNLQQFLECPDVTHQRKHGGVGLGLYCLAQRQCALGGKFGSRTTILHDSNLKITVWFSIPFTPALQRTSIELRPAQSNCSSAALPPSIPEHEEKKGDDVSVPGDQHCGSGKRMENKEAKDKDTTISFPPPAETESRTRILAVDDSPCVMKMMKSMLEKAGYMVQTAGNGQEAVNEIFQPLPTLNPYQLILMDLQMPVMDGFEAIRNIRNREAGHIIIVAMSANNDPDSIAQAYAAGADYFLSKPFRLESIHQIVRDANC